LTMSEDLIPDDERAVELHGEDRPEPAAREWQDWPDPEAA
jgi:hypothetical protein